MDFKTSDELRSFILNRQEADELPQGSSGPCYALVWKKDRWLVKKDNKKITEVSITEVPPNFDLRDQTFVINILTALRTGGPDKLAILLGGLSETHKIS